MKRCNMYMMVATMAVAGMTVSIQAADYTTGSPTGQTTSNTMSNTATDMQNTGGQMADAATTKDARDTLAKIVNDGVEANKFSSLTSYLAKADRQRLGDIKSMNNDDLNTVINQFRQDFKNKYNQEFDLSAEQLSNVMIYAGTDKKSATATFSKPEMNSTAGENNNTMNNGAPNTAGTSGATADRTLNTTGQTISNRSGDNSGSGLTSTSAGNRTGTATNGSNSNSTVHGNDVTATPGVAANTPNDMANNNANTNTMNNTNAMANAAPGMSSLTLNLVNEGHVMNAWRISAPQLSAAQLKQNLVKHIQMLDDQKAAWPSDVNAAYQAVSYHVLSAFSDSAIASER